MLPRHPVLKVVAMLAMVAGSLILILVGFLYFYFEVDRTLVSYRLPGGHTVTVTQDRELDVSDSVLCTLRGPQVSHTCRFVAAIGAGTSAPRFTLHSSTNAQVYWITADTLPDTILYIVDLEDRSYWPGFEDGEHESARGNRLLARVNSSESGYRLQTHEKWIGVK